MSENLDRTFEELVGRTTIKELESWPLPRRDQWRSLGLDGPGLSGQRPGLPTIDPVIRAMMMNDIRKRGVVLPVVVTEDDEVIDGKARMEIARLIGEEVKKIVVGRLSPEDRQELRVALNTYRRHLTREQVRELIAWELEQDSSRSDRMIARKIGVSKGTVAKVRSDGQVGQSDAPRLGEDGKYRKPKVYTQTNIQAKQAQRLLHDLGDAAPGGNLTPRKLRSIARQHRRGLLAAAAEPVEVEDFVIHHSDFRSAPIPDRSASLAICDPPWAEWRTLARPLAEALFRVLRPDGIACLYTGVMNMQEWKDAMLAAGFRWRWQVISVHRQPGSIFWAGAINHRYTPIQVFTKSRGKGLKTMRPLADVIESERPEKDRHIWQQPVIEAEELVRSLSEPGSMICDLCAGSGTVAVAAVRVGEGRRFVGCEIDPGHVRAARGRVAEELRGHSGGWDRAVDLPPS